MKVVEMAGFVNTVLSEWRSFVISPRKMVSQREKDWEKPSKVYKVVGSVISLVALLLALYSSIFGSLNANVQTATFGTESRMSLDLDSTEPGNPKLIGWSLIPSVSVGISFPEGISISPNQPQIAVFGFGAVAFAYKDVVPEKIMSGSSPLLFQLLYGLLLALCIHPFAKILKGKSSYNSCAKYSLLLVSYTLGTAFICAIVTATLFIEMAKFSGYLVFLPWTIFVLLPFVVIGMRGFFAGFSELYDISKKRVFLASIGAWAVTSVLSFITFLPLLHGILVLRPYLDAIV